MKTEYEWCYETVDKSSGDIIDLDFEDKLCNFQDDRKTDTLCLVRREGDETEGEQDRLWAYVKSGKLPETFKNSMGESVSINVPKRFHSELEKFQTN